MLGVIFVMKLFIPRNTMNVKGFFFETSTPILNAGFFMYIIFNVYKKNTPVKNLCCAKAIILVGPGSIKTVRGTDTPNGSIKLIDVA